MKKDWEIKSLGEVCEFISRGISPSYVEQNGLVVINQKCIRDHIVDHSLARQHNETIKKVSNEKLVQKGDVLINSTGTGTLGRVAQVITETRATVDSHVTIVRPNKNLLDERFFAWTLFNIETKIAESGEGASGQTELARETVRNFIISYPLDKQEQKRIVKILDEKFEAVDELKRVTELQITDARELFESRLNEVFEKLKQEHEIKPLKLCVEFKGGGTPSKRNKDYWTGEIPWVSPKDMKVDSIFDAEDHISEAALASSATNLIPKGSILIVVRSGILARTIPLAMTMRNVAVNQDLKAIIVPDNIEQKYLFYLLKASTNDLLSKINKGATVHRLQTDFLLNLPVVIPELVNQKRLSKELDELSEKTKELEVIFRRKITDLEELKKSYLEQAFSGKL